MKLKCFNKMIPSFIGTWTWNKESVKGKWFMAWIQVVLKIFDKLAIFILCCNCSTKNTSITWHGFLGQLPLQFLGWTSEPHHLRGSGSVPRFRTFFYPGVVLTGICLIQVTSCKNAYLYVHICKYWHLNILYIYNEARSEFGVHRKITINISESTIVLYRVSL